MLGRSKDKLFFKILLDVSHNIVETADLFRSNVELLDNKVYYADKIKELELRGDEYTYLLFQELNKTFFTPLDHEDFLKLASISDNVVDSIEACAARFVYLHIDQTTPYIVQFADIFVQCAEHLHTAFRALEKSDYETIKAISVKINVLENEGDRLMRESISYIFDNHACPIELIKMKELYEKLEHVTDVFEDLMDVMGSVVMKYA